MRQVVSICVVSFVLLGGFLGFIVNMDNVKAISWNIEIASSAGSVGEWTSLVLDSNGYPHMSHYDLSSYDLLYTRWTGSFWVTEIADSYDWVGRYSSLALDVNDCPHISYYDRYNEDLKYVRWDGSAWINETVDNEPLSGRWTSLALDSNGHPHISYYDSYQTVLKYASWNGSAWNIDIVAGGGLYSSLELDSNDYPHISYRGNGLWYARWSGTAWLTENVDSALNVGRYSSLALDSNDYPHISYYHSDDNDLRYARWNGTAWSITTIDNGLWKGEYTSIDLDSRDYPHISYHDGEGWDHLKYARWDGSTWKTEIVDTADRTGKFTSIAVDANDQIHISYYDNENYDLKYAKGWPTEPFAPENLVASSGDSQVTLDWSAPTSDGGYPITNYRIYRGGAPGSETFLIEIGNVLTHTDLSLANGQTYYYEVTAVNSLGESPRSNGASAVPATVPGPPTGLSALPGNKEVVLTWSPPVDDGGSAISNYAIYRGMTSGGETLLTTIGAVTSFTDTGLTNGITYFYQVAAINTVGEGASSIEVNALPASFPTEPLNPQTSVSDQAIHIVWNAPLDNGGLPITNYRVYRALISGTETLHVEIGDVTEYDDTGLTNGQRYFYQVSAVNAIGVSTRSSEVSATPATFPGSPQNLVAEGRNGEVELTWSIPSDNGGSPITNFTVYRGLTSGGLIPYMTLGIVMRFTDTGLTNGVTYFYSVTATNAIGEGPSSTEVSATPATLPSEPLNLQAVAGNGEVNLTWEPPESDGGLAIIDYRIFRGTSSGSLSFLVEIGNVLYYRDTGLTNGWTYRYQITAKNSLGESVRSNDVSANPFNQPPTCEVSAPISGSTISGLVSITGTATDTDGGIQKVEVRIDDGPWTQVTGTISWNYAWNSEAVTNGQHTVIIHSYDGEDYSSETILTLMVDNPTQKQDESDMFMTIILLLIVVIVLVIIAFIIVKKKGSKERKEAPEDRD